MALGAAAAAIGGSGASGGGAVTLRGCASVAWLQRVSVARPAERRFLSPLARFFVRSLSRSVSPLFAAVFLRIRITRMETKPVITCLKTLLIVYSFVFWVGNLAMILRGLHLRIFYFFIYFSC